MRAMSLFASSLHCVDVPFEREGVQLFARIVRGAATAKDAPALLFLQGGPGFPSPRERFEWIEYATKRGYQVVLLDQRGTGRSSRIDRAMLDDATIDFTRLRADAIVDDAEALRRTLGLAQWDVLGQSFGGFCLVHYMLRYPDSLRAALFTGGLPSISRGVDEVYKATFATVRARHEELFNAVPWAQERIAQVCEHLEQREEFLPTGERLSARRFRTIGTLLGQEGGAGTIATLLEAPFHPNGAMRTDVLAQIGALVSYESGPLYGVIHESIYGGTVPGATAWSAQRVAERTPGFGADEGLLTGEHVFPFQFDEDPALRPFKEAAHELAAKDDWPNLYAGAAGFNAADHGIRTAAAVYTQDMYVPRQFSLETAEALGINVWENDHMQHDGLRKHGEAVLGKLLEIVGV